MKTRSAKNKGVRLQNWIRDKLYEVFPEIPDEHIKPAIMGETGEDVRLTPEARAIIPIKIEAKNVEKLSVWAAYDQAVSHPASATPVLIMKKNNRKPLAVVDAEYLFKLLRDQYEVNNGG
tara:strand:+ start:393 stop:752 length:360 start_codon:yes stop_codon:yes gene_type:complete